MAFKGGTALSKIYFPKRWRFSEDLDFTVTGNIPEELNRLKEGLNKTLDETGELSGIGFRVRSVYSNPNYVQVKVQYDAILQQKNTTDLDFFQNERVFFPVKHVVHSFEDVPEFRTRVYSIEEIFVEKLRSLFQRARARDYYDLYYIISMKRFDKTKIIEALLKKSEQVDVKLDMGRFLDQTEEVRDYWDRALDRLTSSKPDFQEAQKNIEGYLKLLLESVNDQ